MLLFLPCVTFAEQVHVAVVLDVTDSYAQFGAELNLATLYWIDRLCFSAVGKLQNPVLNGTGGLLSAYVVGVRRNHAELTEMSVPIRAQGGGSLVFMSNPKPGYFHNSLSAYDALAQIRNFADYYPSSVGQIYALLPLVFSELASASSDHKISSTYVALLTTESNLNFDEWERHFSVFQSYALQQGLPLSVLNKLKEICSGFYRAYRVTTVGGYVPSSGSASLKAFLLTLTPNFTNVKAESTTSVVQSVKFARDPLGSYSGIVPYPFRTSNEFRVQAVDLTFGGPTTHPIAVERPYRIDKGGHPGSTVQLPRDARGRYTELRVTPIGFWNPSGYTELVRAGMLSRAFSVRFESEAGIIVLLTILACALAAGVVLALYVRHPSAKIAVGGPAEFQEQAADGQTVDALEWYPGRTYNLEVVIENNAARTFVRPLRGRVRISVQLPAQMYGTDISAHYEENSYPLGDAIPLRGLARGKRRAISVTLDISEMLEPNDLSEPMRMTVTLKSNDRQTVKSRDYQCLIVRARGAIWLGIDLGTTGSSVAWGDQTANVESCLIGNETVIPSAVFVDESYDPLRPRTSLGFTDGVKCGNEAQLRLAVAPERVFVSPKLLLGYENRRNIRQADGRQFSLKGTDILTILATHLTCSARDHITELTSNTSPRLSRAVVAVPNGFTPNKIALMKQCIREVPGIQEVLHIYEAEAATLYYLSNYNKFQENRPPGSSPAVAGGEMVENILVFDMGGGTMNVSVISATFSQGGPTKMDVVARIGYAVGGNAIDRTVASIIDRKARQDGISIADDYPTKLFVPEQKLQFDSEDERKEWLVARQTLRDIAESTKIQMSEGAGKGQGQTDIDFRDRAISISLQEVLDWEPRILEIVRDAVTEAVRLFREHPSQDKIPTHRIHTVLFSGRSSAFPEIEATVEAAIGSTLDQLQDDKTDVDSEKETSRSNTKANAKGATESAEQIHKVSLDQRKECVSIGAAYYGTQRDNLILSRGRTYEHLGLVVQKPRISDAEFLNLISPGRILNRNGVEDVKRNIDVRYNSNVFRFYQIASSNPNSVVRDPKQRYKMSLLAELNLDAHHLDTVLMRIGGDDRFEITIEGPGASQTVSGQYELKEVYDDADESTTWIFW